MQLSLQWMLCSLHHLFLSCFSEYRSERSIVVVGRLTKTPTLIISTRGIWSSTRSWNDSTASTRRRLNRTWSAERQSEHDWDIGVSRLSENWRMCVVYRDFVRGLYACYIVLLLFRTCTSLLELFFIRHISTQVLWFACVYFAEICVLTYTEQWYQLWISDYHMYAVAVIGFH